MITVNHLSKTYQNPDGSSLTVLKDINCEIGPGEVISIIGPSGTGKSTFLRALNLMDPPTGGEILFNGENILAKGYPVHKLRQKMGMVFQSFNLFDHMTVAENIMYAPVKILGLSKADAREEAVSLLRKVGLADSTGREIVPCKYDRLSYALAGALLLSGVVLVLSQRGKKNKQAFTFDIIR